MIIQNRTISVALTCTEGQTSKKTHKILISQNSIELTIIGVARGGLVAPPPSIEMPSIKKNVTKKFLHFQFLLASPRTTVHAYNRNNNNIDNQEARAPSIRFCELIVMYNSGKIKGFCSKTCYLRPSSNLFMNVVQ